MEPLHGRRAAAAHGRSSSSPPLLDAVLANPRSLAVSRRIANENLRMRQFAASMCNVRLPAAVSSTDRMATARQSPHRRQGPSPQAVPQANTCGVGLRDSGAASPRELIGSGAASPAMSKATIAAIVDQYVQSLVEEEEAASFGSATLREGGALAHSGAGGRPTPSTTMSAGVVGGASDAPNVSNAQAKARKYLVAVEERKAPHCLLPAQRPKDGTAVDASRMTTDMLDFVRACGLNTSASVVGGSDAVDDANLLSGDTTAPSSSRRTPHMYVAQATVMEAERRVKHLLTHVVHLKHAHGTHATLRQQVEHAITAAGAVPHPHGTLKSSAAGLLVPSSRGEAAVPCGSRDTASPLCAHLGGTSLRSLTGTLAATTELNRSAVERRTATDGGRTTTAMALTAEQRRALGVLGKVAMGIAVLVAPALVGTSGGGAASAARSSSSSDLGRIPIGWMAVVGALLPKWFPCDCITQAAGSDGGEGGLSAADWVARVASFTVLWTAASSLPPLRRASLRGCDGGGVCTAQHVVDPALMRAAQSAVDGTPISSCPVDGARMRLDASPSSSLPGAPAEAAAKHRILLAKSLDEDAAGSALRTGKSGASLCRFLLAVCTQAMPHSSVGFSISRTWLDWCPTLPAGTQRHPRQGVDHLNTPTRTSVDGIRSGTTGGLSMQQLHRCFLAMSTAERCACATCARMSSIDAANQQQPLAPHVSSVGSGVEHRCVLLLASQLDAAFAEHMDAIGLVNNAATNPLATASVDPMSTIPPALRCNTAVAVAERSTSKIAASSAAVTPLTPGLTVPTTLAAEPSIASRFSGSSDDDLSTSCGAPSLSISGGHTHRAAVFAMARTLLMQRFAKTDCDGDGAWTFFEWTRAVFSASIAFLSPATMRMWGGRGDSEEQGGSDGDDAEALVVSFLAAQWLSHQAPLATEPAQHPIADPLVVRRQLEAARRMLRFLDDDCDVFGFVLTK